MEMSKTDVALTFRFHESVGLVRKADVPVTTLRCDCPSSATRFGKITLVTCFYIFIFTEKLKVITYHANLFLCGYIQTFSCYCKVILQVFA